MLLFILLISYFIINFFTQNYLEVIQLFSRKITELRKVRKISQSELADILGFSRAQLDNYEQGSLEPDFKTLEVIANYFEVSTDFLLGIKDANTDKTNEKNFVAFKTDPKLQQSYIELSTSKIRQNDETILLSAKLKQLRKDAKMTQKELAKKIHVTHVSISGYESGKRKPNLETLKLLADYFDLTMDSLLNSKKNKNLLSMSKLSVRLKSIRKSKYLSQTQLAKKLNTTKATISNYENAYSTPSNEMLVSISLILDCSIDYLLGTSNNPSINRLNQNNEFKTFANNPDLQQWFNELLKSTENDLHRLHKIWDIIKANEK